jgi:hypothetical protein
MHDRVLAVIEGRKPDRIPFCDRLELWRTALVRQGRLPARFEELSLIECHHKVGMGQLKFVAPYEYRLLGAELSVSVDGQLVRRETDPVTSRWPVLEDLVRTDRPGTTTIQLSTPVGKISLRQGVHPQTVLWAENPYLEEHPIKTPEDFDTVGWLMDHLEVVPRFDRVKEAEEDVGDFGFVIPRIDRTPFQEVLVELLGEVATFYALYDEPERVGKLLAGIDALRTETAHLLAGLDYPYVEFADGVTGHMTNPKLFAKYVVPALQRYTELYHAQGKKVGSHFDGELRPLLSQLKDTGLDVIESVSPAPLTQCTFDELWGTLQGERPIMWGVIPSPLLEERTPEPELHEFVEHLLETVGSAPIILGVSDMVLGNNLIERVEWAARRIEEHVV